MAHIIGTAVLVGGLITVMIGVLSGVILVTQYLFNNGDDESLL
jgi:hypothetical protein